MDLLLLIFFVCIISIYSEPVNETKIPVYPYLEFYIEHSFGIHLPFSRRGTVKLFARDSKVPLAETGENYIDENSIGNFKVVI